jgi:hypothetical protein
VLNFTSTFFIRNGLESLDFASTLACFSFEMTLTLLAHCSFQNGLDLTDFPFMFQGQEAQGGTRRTPLGSILRRTTLYCSRFRALAKSKIIWPKPPEI